MWTKAIAQVLMPLPLAIEALVVAAILARFGKRRAAASLRIGAVAFLWVLSTPVASDAFVRTLEDRYPPTTVDATPKADAIVVLGGGIAPACPPRPSPDLTEGADRVLLAARLHRAGKAPVVIVTGGGGPAGGDARPECRDMADLLVEWGVPRDAIVEEEAARDTAGNASETKQVLAARHLERVLLVTSAVHMPRALAAFRKAGVDAVPCPTDFLAVDPDSRTVLDWLPDAGALDRSTAAAHEWLGHLWYRMSGKA
jgi:uncharacterized SAM-binding protein YcdF (DUF218 family)